MPKIVRNIDKVVERILLVVFLASIPSTFIFWTFLSNSDAVDESTERAFADILNKNFRHGDIIFAENDWDLDFMKHLDAGILPIFLNLKDTNASAVSSMKGRDSRIFLLFQSPDSWDETAKRLSLKELERFEAGTGLVVMADSTVRTPRKNIIFTQDINRAKVWFSKGEEIFPCRKEGRRWRCSDEEWNYVGAITAVIGGESKQAVWAHPLADKTLNIEFSLPADSRELVFNSAFQKTAWHSSNKAPVEIEITADGKQILKYSNPSVKETFEKKALIPEGSKKLLIRITASDQRQRHFVFNGYVTDGN